MAGLFLIYLAPTDAFSFATSEVLSMSSILTICGVQMIPEFFLDLFCTFNEIKNGISLLHENYWSLSAGADPKSKHLANRIGDLPKAMVNKLCTTICLSAFVLVVSLK